MVSFPTESLIHEVCILYIFPRSFALQPFAKSTKVMQFVKNDVHVISEFDSFIFQITFISFQRKDLQPPESINRDISEYISQCTSLI